MYHKLQICYYKKEDYISTKLMTHSASSIISLSDTDLIEQLTLM